MPELPEVETLARWLREGRKDTPPLPGHKILRVSLHWPRHVATPSPSTFRRKIRGRQIVDVRRRAKYAMLPLDRGTLLIHLRMSGDLAMVPKGAEKGRYDHTIFYLEGGWELRFSDARKFGKVYLVDDPEMVFGSLGPEPLSRDFRPADLAASLQKRRRALKPLLLDQAFLAGLGNIYADEALHRAGLHPLRRSDTLNQAEVEALWGGIRAALKEGLSHNGASIDWVYRGGNFQNHFRVYRRTGEACPICSTVIARIVVGQRGTHFCPTCQPESSA